MYILGLSSYSHESSCSLIKDGQVKFVIEEERLNREKHTWKYPANAIAQCLALEGIGIRDIDHITFFWIPNREIIGNLTHVLKYFPRSLNFLRAPSGGSELSFLDRIVLMNNIGVRIARQFGLKAAPAVHFIEHHLAHAASAFFVSRFEKAAVLTIDGRGESTSTMMSVGDGNRITKILEIKVPHSLGHLYAAVTDYLGFKPFFDEWKVMGMSAYGKDTYAADFAKIVQLWPDGAYRLNLDYVSFHTHGAGQWVSGLFLNTFGPKREKGEQYDQRHFDIAYALQKTVEKTGVHLANGIYKRTKLKRLCMTGGVVLNCLMNKKIVEQTPFEEFFFQPIANDAGTSLGSALYYYHQVLGKPRGFEFDSPYLGMDYTDDAIEKTLKEKGISYRRSPDIARETARHIAQGKIVGWFQGRMEAGPRALGHRSIVADPTDPGMKDRLNARVKRREMFRPFAPSVLEEKAGEYFILPKGQRSPYMILIADVREDKKEILPAITHNDGTARVHTVNKKTSPEYWKLIEEFGKIKGVPVLLNTSFNENEPIVCTPAQAIDCFLRTDFDVLAIGNFLADKHA
ncbi:MAG: carbamoyl transferase [Candidatus Omnitrophica bacterium]|nr:carbamoyl transferase [Candidatus Omnitrophota bacterium]